MTTDLTQEEHAALISFRQASARIVIEPGVGARRWSFDSDYNEALLKGVTPLHVVEGLQKKGYIRPFLVVVDGKVQPEIRLEVLRSVR